MSCIYFTAPEREVTVRGPERAAMGLHVNNAMDRYLGDALDQHPERIRELMNPDLHRDLMRANRRLFMTALHVSYNDPKPPLQWKGVRIEPWMLGLNTAVRTDDPDMTLAARIHGQCEIHGWVDGPDRMWFAGLVRRALERSFLRQGMYWDGVLDLLEESDASPVVTSYSVTGSFPTYQADWMPKASEEVRESVWDALKPHEQFGIAMADLRRRGGGLQWRPDEWSDYTFGLGVAAQDLLADDWRERLDRAVEPVISRA